MRKQLTAITVIILLMAAALPALADSVTLGDRYFQRAWRVYVTRNNTKALEYFKGSAKAYGEALAENPRGRTMNFQSSLDKAGIAMYFAGEYDLCIKTLNEAMGDKDRLWDAALFIALAQGRKGDQEAALKAFDRFLNANPSQRLITTEMSKVLPGVEKGTIPLKDAIDAIEKETQHQFVENVARYDGRSGAIPATDGCGGAYWWRKNSAPCSRNVFRFD